MSMPFNVDKNAGYRDYEDLSVGNLRVTKVFQTLQSEGPFTGQWAVFLRLAGCNLGSKLSCPWCDADFRLGDSSVMFIADILKQIELEAEKSGQKRLLVITGGEPLLQSALMNFIRIMFDYNRDCADACARWHLQIETNGYFWPAQMIDFVDRSCWLTVVVSPKVNFRGVYPNLDNHLIRHSTLKFLVDSDPASPYHRPPPYLERFRVEKRPIYVSPITIYDRAPDPNHAVTSIWPPTPIDLERTRRNYAYAAELVMKTPGTRLSLQTHLFAAVE